MKRILITGAGAPGGPGIIKALNQNYEVHGADADPNATGAQLCQHFHPIPKANDPLFVDALINLAEKHTISVIIPLVTRELELFSKNEALFAKINCKIVVSPLPILEICNDKHQLLQSIGKEGLAIPKYVAVKGNISLKAAIQQLDYPQKAICVKPSKSNGMRGFRILDNQVNKADLFWNEKPNNVHIEPEELQKILGDTFEELLVMEYLPGKEYTVDCIAHRGKAKLILPRERLKMNNGISTRGKFVKHEGIIDYCRRIIELFDLHGPIGVQLKEDTHGIPKMLEINPRLQGTTVAAEGLGFNIPDMCIQQALGTEPQLNRDELAWGKEFGRYYTEIFWD
jgi:carbamoyl-phosphate synthase large subunit